MSVVVMLCYARSGGTLLNRCLGSLPKTIVLSEVNPVRENLKISSEHFITVKAQAENWYNIPIKSKDFVGHILELEDYCRTTDQYLIIRDWSYVNFAPCNGNDWSPANRFLVLDVLQDKCETIPFAFVRDSIDVWISRGVTIEEFYPPYLQYVREILRRGVPIFKYENFCREPDAEMKRICNLTGLEFSDQYKNFAAFTKVLGDTSKSSRGVAQKVISPMPRKRLLKQRIAQINEAPEMIEANSLLQYPTSYSGMSIETPNKIFRDITWLFYRKLFRK